MATLSPTLAGVHDLVTGAEWSPAQVRELFHLTAGVKAHPERYRSALGGKFLAMIFEKPSLRTRVTFDVGIQSLGGGAIFLDHAGTRLGQRESIRDVAKNLDRWVHAIVARTFEQRAVEELAAHAAVPVINALSDTFHPCQALADFFTLEEHLGGLRGVQVAYVGDGNNVSHSLLHVAARVGAHIRLGVPQGYEPDPAVVADARRTAVETGSKIEIVHSPEEAVAGAQAVYTDVWASMGQEAEASAREAVFMPFQVNERLFARAARGAFFMHCLPAHRGLEVTDAVVDSPQSIVYDQAENRLHVQKAILLTLMS